VPLHPFAQPPPSPLPKRNQVLPKDTSVRDTALTLARAFVAAWDASIAAWKVKYGVLH
jgi:hypothetical protein